MIQSHQQCSTNRDNEELVKIGIPTQIIWHFQFMANKWAILGNVKEELLDSAMEKTKAEEKI